MDDYHNTANVDKKRQKFISEEIERQPFKQQSLLGITTVSDRNDRCRFWLLRKEDSSQLITTKDQYVRGEEGECIGAVGNQTKNIRPKWRGSRCEAQKNDENRSEKFCHKIDETVDEESDFYHVLFRRGQGLLLESEIWRAHKNGQSDKKR